MFIDFFFMVSSNLLFIKIAIVLCTSFYGPHRAMGNVLIFKWAEDRNQKYCQTLEKKYDLQGLANRSSEFRK